MKRRKKTKSPVIWILLVFMCTTGLLAFTSKGKEKPPPEPPGASSEDAVQTGAGGYTYVNKTADDIHRGELVLINDGHKYRFEDENILQSVYDFKNDSYSVKDKNVTLRETVIEHLNDLLDGFESETGNRSVNIISGYRTRPYQQTLLDREIERTDAVTAAMWVSKPGHSEHHSGLALDLGIYGGKGVSSEYTGEGEYAWINKNCHKYGFIVRYKESKSGITGIAYEPWHFRYVGVPHSYVIEKKGFCYEEYIDYLKGFEFSEEHLTVVAGGAEYEIYYAVGTKIPVPKRSEYTVSGNNTDGFIVTVRK